MNHSSQVDHRQTRARAIPGETGIWVLVLGDMFIFGIFFVVYSYYRGLNVDLYNESQLALNKNYGAINTVLLLVSSWLVILAVIDIRDRAGAAARKLIIGAIGCGLGFSVVKLIEFSEKVSSGIGISENEFFSFYYIFTGIHFIHLLIGIGVLAYLWHIAGPGFKAKHRMGVIESGAIFWHMVDLLWIILFPLLYLVR